MCYLRSRVSSVNLFTREISIKIVYYGPGLGGKTSSLQFIHRALKPDSRGQLVSLATGVDRTLYFDFLPVKLPKLRGYSIRVQLYTVPGQVHYNSTRKLVLAGCDGVVFVADSQRERETANVESFENLRENLVEQGLRLEQLPHLFEYNKRDVPRPLTVDELNLKLNPFGAPTFETVATSGTGVFDALKSITALVLNDLRRRGVWDGGVSEPKPATEFDRNTDTSIAQRLQALSDAAAAVERLEPAAADGTPRSQTAPMFSVAPSGAVSRPHPAPAIASGPVAASGGVVSGAMSTGGSGLARLPIASRIGGPGVSLAELLPEGPPRDRVAAAEAELLRGDYAQAVRIAAQSFAEAARAESTSTEIAPVLHALLLGLDGQRYLRFCEVARRAELGAASSQDALYALFFLVDGYLER